MDSDPQKRPYADDIWSMLNDWNNRMEGADNIDLDNEDTNSENSELVNKNADNKNSNLENKDANNKNSDSVNKVTDSDIEDADIIKRQFLAADKMVKELQTTLPKHPDIMYISKIINTQKTSSAIKTALASKPIDSAKIPLGKYYIR
ncbi:hypothetical protein F8M41_012815 [Gigaspora margarita]|uniref:Uncharacterized protein n=1 Tax=Gigaspora margarita TaxID=4874 RepID=A0A8H4ASS7_GIGMA|nr:hypothetical protein F8M41_012815 [Gigaspora margarita]